MNTDTGNVRPDLVRRLSTKAAQRAQLVSAPNVDIHLKSKSAGKLEVGAKTEMLQSMSHVSDTGMSTAPTTKSKYSYTISSKRSTDGTATAPSTSISSESPNMSKKTSPNQPKQQNADKTVTSISHHHGETATINVPSTLSSDLKARLQALREFRTWDQRIQSHGHDEIKGSYEAGKPLRIPNLRLQRSRTSSHNSAEISSTPTPFSSPAILPTTSRTTPVATPESTGLKRSSPPNLELGGPRQTNKSIIDQQSSSSRTITISSTPVVELVRRASLKSQDSQKLAVGRSQSRSKKYPPISYPSGFDEEKAMAKSIKALARDSSQSRKSGASVSPMTRPASDNTPAETEIRQTATPHDKRGHSVFYTTIHHFTECSHSSPPASRPIDPGAQPRMDPQFIPSDPSILRAIIPGRCFNCETTYRRQQEDVVMTDFIGKVSSLLERLDPLLKKVEFDMDSPSEEVKMLNDKHGALLLGPHHFPEDVYDLGTALKGTELPPLSDDPDVLSTMQRGKESSGLSFQDRMAVQIRLLEADIRRIEYERDQKVEKVWQGYTHRWGPGTLGAQKGVNRYSTREYDQPPCKELESLNVNGGNENVDDQSMFHPAYRTPSTNSPARLTGTLTRNDSRSVSRGRRSRADSKIEVLSVPDQDLVSRNSSNISHRDVPGSREPGEAKMRVGWIRD